MPVHVLLMNEYFPPDTSATAKCAAQVAETLAANHRVTVLAGRPSYDPTERHPRYLIRREMRPEDDARLISHNLEDMGGA